MKLKKCLVIVYSHPEGYPPTLNAIDRLSERFETVHLIYQNRREEQWQYPANVVKHNIGRFMTFRAIEQAPMYRKVFELWLFISNLSALLFKNRFDVVVMYDPFSTLAYTCAIGKYKGSLLWYHNHDVLEKKHIGRWSLSRLALWAERKIFNKINIFSLPSVERLSYFPALRADQIFFHIPNYPSLKRYSDNSVEKKISTELHILYQGHIGEGHGLEQLSDYISQKNKYRLTLLGVGQTSFIERLCSSDRIRYMGVIPYSKIPLLETGANVGWGVMVPKNILLSTGGTASNKIYEYAARGLPVVLFDSQQFRFYLSNYKWTFFTDLTEESMEEMFSSMATQLADLRREARLSFESQLNFEQAFMQVISHISNI